MRHVGDKQQPEVLRNGDTRVRVAALAAIHRNNGPHRVHGLRKALNCAVLRHYNHRRGRADAAARDLESASYIQLQARGRCNGTRAVTVDY